MTVAFYFQYNIVPEMGGTERVTSIIAQELEARNIRCLFIARKRHSGPSADELVSSRQRYLPHADILNCKENEAFIHKLLKEEQVNVVVNQDAMEISSFFFSKTRFPETKIISVIHYNLYGALLHIENFFKQDYIYGNSHWFKYCIQRLLVPYYRHKARKQADIRYKCLYDISDRVVLLSDSYIEEYPTTDKSHIVAIPNPLTIKSATGHIKKDKLIILVSRLVYAQKRIDYFLEAWKKVEPMFSDWNVCILGDGPAKNYYQEYARKLKLNNVEFCGRVAPEAYYKRAALICMTSAYEGFGLVLTEGMMYGCVPVAFDSYTAAHDIITHMEDGILVPAFDVGAYADYIRQLISNESLRSQLSQAAQMKTRKFSLDIIGEKWENILRCI